MPNQQPIITDASGRRQFVCSPAAVIALIIRPDERFLMLAHPRRPTWWEPVNGAVDGGETVLEAVLRETREEAGAQVQVRPLTAVHAYTFRYDDNVQFMISLVYLLEYQGGEVAPASDMGGSQARWLSVEELESGAFPVLVPHLQQWVFRRAREFYRVLAAQPDPPLQPVYDASFKNKHEM